MNILLVEHNPHDVRLFTTTVDGQAKVAVATSGADLDRVFRRGKFGTEPMPNLVVLDLNIPVLNGHEVVNVLKANSSSRRIPVVIWSGSEDPRDIHRASDLGACAYIVKDTNGAETQLRAVADFWVKTVRYPNGANGMSKQMLLLQCSCLGSLRQQLNVV